MNQPFKIVSVTPQYWPQLKALFESDAECRECWCMNHRIAPGNNVPINDEAQAALKQAILAGQVHGLLVLNEAGTEALAWCGLDQRADLAGHDCTFPLPENYKKRWSVHCFFIHREHRGKGLARQLLHAAENYAREQGAQILEGYPSPDDGQPIFEFAGPLKLYKDYQQEEQVNPDYLRMIKSLG